MSNVRIAIDGTASAGKGSIARGLAKRMDYPYVDTGAMYRSLAFLLLRTGSKMNDHQMIDHLLSELYFDFKWSGSQLQVYVNGEDFSERIRGEEIGKYASIVSTVPLVRETLSTIQKRYAKSSSLVMDGRDIGTIIIPDAELKIFVDADIHVRAERRFLEMQNKGIETTRALVFKELQERDQRDRNRKVAPLKMAKDARLLDTTSISIEQGIGLVYSWAQTIIFAPSYKDTLRK